MFITRANETMMDSLLSKVGVSVDEFVQAEEGLTNKVRGAIHVLQKLPANLLKGIYVGTSGGKDSVVVQALAECVFGQNMLPIVHTPKPGVTHLKTLEFLYRMDRKVIYCPSYCHSTLGLQTQIDGTRIYEHDRTDGRSTDLVVDGKNISRKEMKPVVINGLFGLNFVYPIYNWTDADVWAYIITHGIAFSEEYLA